MFGSKAKQELQAVENQLREVKEKLAKEEKVRADLEKELDMARDTIVSLQAELSDTDFEKLKEKSRETIAEYEGLKDLYTRKVQEFDDSKEEAEQDFAREAALQRFNLENEIRDSRQANQEYVASTVKSFGESYNYYLNQIKVLMDALSDVAARTGSTLFEQNGVNLKEEFGQQMVGKLKSGAEELHGEDGDRIVIGSPEEIQVEEAADAPEEESLEEVVVEAVEEAEAEELTEAAEEAVEEAAVIEDVEDAVEEAAGEILEEAAPEIVEEVAEEIAAADTAE